jgi:hypothetical protein
MFGERPLPFDQQLALGFDRLGGECRGTGRAESGSSSRLRAFGLPAAASAILRSILAFANSMG